MVQAAVPPALALLLEPVGLLSHDAAVTTAIAVGVVALFMWGVLIGRRVRLRPLALLATAMLDAAFGVVIVLLKVLVH